MDRIKASLERCRASYDALTSELESVSVGDESEVIVELRRGRARLAAAIKANEQRMRDAASVIPSEIVATFKWCSGCRVYHSPTAFYDGDHVCKTAKELRRT